MNKLILIVAIGCLLVVSCTSHDNSSQSSEPTIQIPPSDSSPTNNYESFTFIDKDGNEQTIRVVEVHRYPQDYDVETGARTAPVVKPKDDKTLQSKTK